MVREKAEKEEGESERGGRSEPLTLPHADSRQCGTPIYV